MRRRKGFTLIEVLITIVIVTILAEIALPYYSEYVLRGKLAYAIQTLSDLRVKQEQYFLDNRTYAAAGGAPACGTPNLLTQRYFDYTCVAADTAQGSTYVFTAVGKAAERLDDF